MKSTLFITGASGFVGSTLLERLDLQSFDTIYCLSRSGVLAHRLGALRPNLKVVSGGLFDSDAYGSALGESSLVVHLAAATGNASEQEHIRVNAEGTAFLVKQCEALGVRRFLHVSTIAARFADIRNYPYAQSKRQAEETVRSSRLAYTIVRPTIVLGSGSPVGQRLQSLGQAPLIPMIGSGSVKVQPIHVADLADCLLTIIATNRFNHETLELGGPEVLTMQALLTRIHRLRHARDPRVLHIPFAPLRWLVALTERLPVRLPISAGQLASFANDGTARPNDLVLQQQPGMKSLEETLKLQLHHG